ncbi:MAG: alpha/beta hydrolase [Clostridia bacterium]|nr:alpha/beta hydrolase [Clostridia bacterium]
MNEGCFQINESGVNVRCRAYIAGGADAAVIYCHGFGGHKDNRAAKRFADRVIAKNKGVAVITFDLPCHGDDVRKLLSLDDCDKYIAAVIAGVKKRLDPKKLYGYSTSFGGYLFLKYIRDRGMPFGKVALRCPAVDMYGTLMRLIPEGDRARLEKGKPIEVGFDRFVKFDKRFTGSLLANPVTDADFTPYAKDMLVVGADRDEIVDPETVAALALKNGTAFTVIHGADHRFTDPEHMDAAIKEIAGFFGLKA